MIYFKILLGICLLLGGVYTIFDKCQSNDFKDTPISSPKILFSGILLIILGVVLILEAITDI